MKIRLVYEINYRGTKEEIEKYIKEDFKSQTTTSEILNPDNWTRIKK